MELELDVTWILLLVVLAFVWSECKFCLVTIVLCRYPYEEAATVAISTIKEFANDIKEVILFVCCFHDLGMFGRSFKKIGRKKICIT